MKTTATTAEARTTATAPMVLVTIPLAAIDIALFVATNLVADAIACVVAIAITFVGRRQRG